MTRLRQGSLVLSAFLLMRLIFSAGAGAACVVGASALTTTAYLLRVLPAIIDRQKSRMNFDASANAHPALIPTLLPFIGMPLHRSVEGGNN
jgi:hypothetical protein